MKIGIDFDHVLFDTEKFKEKLFDQIHRFDETYHKATDEHGIYRPEKHAEVLGIDVSEIHDALHHAAECLYEDVRLLEEIREKHELVIVSRGDPKFQSEKIEQSGVQTVIGDFIVVQKKAKDEGTGIEVLIDDAVVEHERVDLPEKRRMLFDRSKHAVKDIVEWIKRLEE